MKNDAEDHNLVHQNVNGELSLATTSQGTKTIRSLIEIIQEREEIRSIKENSQCANSIQTLSTNNDSNSLSCNQDLIKSGFHSSNLVIHHNKNDEQQHSDFNSLETCVISVIEDKRKKLSESFINLNQNNSGTMKIISISNNETDCVQRLQSQFIDLNLTNSTPNISTNKSNDLIRRMNRNKKCYSKRFERCFTKEGNKTLLCINSLGQRGSKFQLKLKRPIPKKGKIVFHKVNDINKSRLKKQTKVTSKKCKFCNKRFRLKVDLKRHLKMHTQKCLYECNHCGKTYVKIFYLQRHLQKHKTNINKNKRFLCVYGKKLHMQTKNSDQKNNFPCQNCNKWFKSISKLRKGYDSKKKKYNCTDCDKVFKRPNALKTHIAKIHLLENRFLCCICGKTFATLNGVNRHERNHTVKDTLSCKICGKCFSQNSQLQEHNKLHIQNDFSRKLQRSSLTSYLCLHCGERFNKLGMMMRHLRFHDNKEALKCLQCNKKFKGTSEFKSHTEICYNQSKRRIHKFNLRSSGKRTVKTPRTNSQTRTNSQKVLSSEINNVKIKNVTTQIKEANKLVKNIRKLHESMVKGFGNLSFLNCIKTCTTNDFSSIRTGENDISNNFNDFSFYIQDKKDMINKKVTPIIQQPKFSKKSSSTKNITDKNSSYNQNYEKQTLKKNVGSMVSATNKINIGFWNGIFNNKNKSMRNFTLKLFAKITPTDLPESRKIKASCNQKNERNNYNLRLRPSIKKCKCKACKQSLTEILSRFNDIVHVSKDSFVCSLCNTTFTQPIDLMEHMRKHLEDEPYLHRAHGDAAEYMTIRPRPRRNTKSKKIYTYSNNDNDDYDDVVDFVCSICDRVFKSKNALTKHEATHPINEEHSCRRCGNKFNLFPDFDSYVA